MKSKKNTHVCFALLIAFIVCCLYLYPNKSTKSEKIAGTYQTDPNYSGSMYSFVLYENGNLIIENQSNSVQCVGTWEKTEDYELRKQIHMSIDNKELFIEYEGGEIYFPFYEDDVFFIAKLKKISDVPVAVNSNDGN